jgi:serine/threonine-protein kinase HipA
MMTIPIYFEERLVGMIDVDVDGAGFTYDPSWLTTLGAFPISTLMPLDKARIGPDVFLPWAANLLPESGNLQAVGQFLGVAASDVVGILSQIGRDTAGALSIGRPGTSSPENWRPIEKPADLERVIEELPKKPFLVGEEGVSMSLAGAQSKMGVAVDAQGRICIPLEGSPSTHILKPEIPRLWGSVQNEALCLTLAKRLKLPIAEVTTGVAGARSYLLVKRYDRRLASGRWRRLHQEDFCQALGKPPNAKYEANQTGVRGPSLKDMFGVVRRMAPTIDIIRLLEMVVFNVIACNTDAHAKNYSLMIRASGATLAPMYDVMCGEVWENVTKNLAQKIAGKNRGEHLKGRHWQRFALECGLNPRQVLSRIAMLAAETEAQAAAAAGEVAKMPAGPHPLLPQAVDAIRKRAGTIAAQLKDTEQETEEQAAPSSDDPSVDEARTDMFSNNSSG